MVRADQAMYEQSDAVHRPTEAGTVAQVSQFDVSCKG